MDSAMRVTLQASTRLAVRARPCPSCSSYTLTQRSRSPRLTRSYTTTPRRDAVGEVGQGAAARMGKEIFGQMRDSGSRMTSVSRAQMQKDLGLFPGTFTQAPFKEYLPLLLKDPKTFLRVVLKLIRKPFVNTFGYVLPSHFLFLTEGQPLTSRPS